MSRFRTHYIAPLLKLIASVFILGELFGWRPPRVLHGPAWAFVIAWCAIALACALIGHERVMRASRLIARPPAWVFGGVCMLVMAIVSGAIVYNVFNAAPHIQDEINYYWQAKVFASGYISLPSPELYDFYTARFMVNDGRHFSLFQPGWPMLMSIGHLLGSPHLVAPLVSASIVGFFFGAARRVLPEAPARWATLGAMCCAVWAFMGASMMSHATAALCGVAALYFALRWAEGLGVLHTSPDQEHLTGPRNGWLVCAGVAIGYCFVTRAATAVALGAPLGLGFMALWCNARLRARVPVLKASACFLLGFVPVAAIQLLYNHALTGAPLTFPQNVYFDLTEPIKGCHRLGIGDGIGCPREHGPDLGKHGYTWARARHVTRIRLEQFRWDLFGTGFGAALVVLTIWARRVGLVRWLVLMYPASLVGLYVFYYYHGNYLGARYYFEMVPMVLLAIAMGLWGLGVSAISWHERAQKGWLARVALGALIATACVLPGWSVTREIPRLWDKYSDPSWGMSESVQDAIDAADIHDAVVITYASDKYYLSGLWANTTDLESGDVVVVRDLGKQNSQLRTRYPDRAFYRFVRPRTGKGALRPTRVPETNAVFIEGESKFPPRSRRGGYAEVQSLTGFGWRRASGGKQLFFGAKRPDAYVSFDQYIPEAGTYRVRASFGMGPDYGKVRLLIDDVPVGVEPFDGFSTKIKTSMYTPSEAVTLGQGTHRVTLQVAGKGPTSRGWVLGLDSLALEKID